MPVRCTGGMLYSLCALLLLILNSAIRSPNLVGPTSLWMAPQFTFQGLTTVLFRIFAFPIRKVYSLALTPNR